MPHFIVDAVVTSHVIATVEADNLEHAKEKLRRHEWDDYDADGGEVQEVDCKIDTTRPDPAFEDEH